MSWGDLSPVIQEADRSRLHPAYQLQPRLANPFGPRLDPSAQGPPPPPILGELPPAGPRGVRHAVGPAVEMAAGLSPRLLWTLFVTWRARWGAWVGISRPGMDVLAAYVRIYLFQEEPVSVLLRLQQLLAILLPATAIGPRWLWEMIFW